jgi:hypothetical protein
VCFFLKRKIAFIKDDMAGAAHPLLKPIRITPECKFLQVTVADSIADYVRVLGAVR